MSVKLMSKFRAMLHSMFLVAATALPDTANPANIERFQAHFEIDDTPLVGHLYVPANRAPSRLPAIVVVPPWLNVKEQVATNYARALAEKGLVTLAFDFRHWGESGGEPREFESPQEKIKDIKAAVSFLQQRPEVDANRVGLLGTCFGAGYALKAAIEDNRIRAVATVAAWIHDPASLEATFGGDEIARRRQVGTAALAQFRENGTVDYVPASSATDKEAAMFGVDYYLDKTRGPSVKQWINHMAVMSWPGWLDFNVIPLAPRLTTPLLMVHSDNSALPENVRRFYSSAAGPKDLFWTQGAHTDFYDRPLHMAKAADAVVSHFQRVLMPAIAANAAPRPAVGTR